MELVFKRRDELLKIQLQLVEGPEGLLPPDAALLVLGQQVGHPEAARQPPFVHPQGDHEVEAQQRQVREVVLGEGFLLQVGVDAPKAPQPALSPPPAAEVGDDDLSMVPYYDEADLPHPVYYQTYLSLYTVGKLGEVTGQFPADYLLRRDPPPVDPLQGLEFACFETCGLTLYSLDTLSPPPKKDNQRPRPLSTISSSTQRIVSSVRSRASKKSCLVTGFWSFG